MRFLIAISGPVAVGKSAVLKEFEARFGAVRVSTRPIILARKGCPNERAALQAAGDALDNETGGAWVAEGVKEFLDTHDEPEILLVDAVRINLQIDHLRRAFRDKVVHIHLTASAEVLSRRYQERPPELREFETYEEVRASATERAVANLTSVADVVVNTDRSTPKGALALAVASLGLFPLTTDRLVDVIVGAQFGSEGKGNICSYLANEYDVLMRVGGPNAGHKVPDPVYTYVQIPSGTRSNPNAKVLIGAGATIWVPRVLKETIDHGLTPDRFSVDPNAMIIHQSDRDLEGETLGVIGSTKQGVGAATARKVMGRDGHSHLRASVRLARDVPELKPFCRDTKVELEKAYTAGRRIMLEGTQGTDLSLHHGQYPHVTSRETTASGCLADAGIPPHRVRRVVLVTRTYPIRVGGPSGELPNPVTPEIISQRSGLPVEQIEKTEVGSVSGTARRIAEFDFEQVRRSVVLNGATDIALTFADYLDQRNQRATNFDELTDDTRTFIAEVERVTGVPVSLVSKAFDAHGVVDRRAW
jgi:adenylosuccinate synthase